MRKILIVTIVSLILGLVSLIPATHTVHAQNCGEHGYTGTIAASQQGGNDYVAPEYIYCRQVDYNTFYYGIGFQSTIAQSGDMGLRIWVCGHQYLPGANQIAWNFQNTTSAYADITVTGYGYCGGGPQADNYYSFSWDATDWYWYWPYESF